ncbi:MAG: hypothetical protein JRG97_05695 [Deltaproteobacteria bacterium]|nr:hypothetical protein [Deltaproteobacteria bacterium]MBW2052639.1 hypothetical protein [Deltaproteobacteria bacterium]MBW2140552.1 hypothetical protein [Deltaproteobacteria bacterium]MBW2323052.1 hypothetical protein [Deltaproteobacteria bacterium]
MKNKKIFFSIILFMILVPFLVHAEPKVNMPQTRIEFEKPFFQGEVIQGVFELNNDGDSVLIIERVDPG